MAFNPDRLDRNGRNGTATFSNYNYDPNNGDRIQDVTDGYFDGCKFSKEKGWAGGIIYARMADGFAIFSIGDDGSEIRLAGGSGVTTSAYQNRSQSDRVINPSGVEEQKFRNYPGWQDLLRNPDMTELLTGTTNVELVNHGQYLEPIPDAVAPPYWTDPGPVTLSRTGTGVPGSIPGMIDFMLDGSDRFCRFTNPEGVGDSSNSKRRTQLFFDWVSGRKKVRWDLSFRLNDLDDCPYSPPPNEYLWKMLIFQWKGAGEPLINVSIEAVPDKPDTYNLFMLIKYSSLPSDTETYRRSYNQNQPASIQGQSGVTRYIEREMKKGS
jgi:hypothetical protein